MPRTGALIDAVHLASRLTLFTFALPHFLNRALAALAALIAAAALASFVTAACEVARLDPPLSLPFRAATLPAAEAHGLDAELDVAGAVRAAAALFVDIRGFTRLNETKLAFDVAYILNTFFAEAGRAVEACGGNADKYIGDGLMAVFEHTDGVPAAARNALAAVDAALQTVNRRLGREIEAPLSLAMGLRGGRLVGGKVGFGDAAHPTVIGRVVNIASRLETLAKSRDAELAVGLDAACSVMLVADFAALTPENAPPR